MEAAAELADGAAPSKLRIWIRSFALGFFGVLMLIIAVLLTIIFCASWRGRSMDLAYDNVTFGSSEAQVTALLGSPDQVTGAPENASWDGENLRENQTRCVKEFVYEPPSLTFEVYKVGFDTHGNAVAKYHHPCS